VSDLTAVAVQQLDPILRSQLIAEDAEYADKIPGPQRFAVPTNVAMAPDTHGLWEPTGDGGRIWRLRIHAPGATDLNFGFTRFRLPDGATLHLVSEDHDFFRGPYGEWDNRDHGELWTPAIPGEQAVIELYVPADPSFEPELLLGHIGRGYRDVFQTTPRAIAKQGSCNVDVTCSEADEWSDQIRSVAVYSINGYLTCSGVLVMDVPRSFRPFFLTAAHCGVNASNEHTVVTYWNVHSPECGKLDGGSMDQNVIGATLVSRRDDVDFALLELDSAPPPEYDVNWTGWDRRSSHTPPGGVSIHHPNADEKAISINENDLTVTSSCIASTAPGTHWDVDNWERGTTEPGSSGGGLWDPQTHLLVGFLSGGTASCDNPAGHDCFGRLAAAWDGPSAGERLRDWLDPQNTGREMVPGGVRSDPPARARMRPVTTHDRPKSKQR
jgi:hypothetical protein